MKRTLFTSNFKRVLSVIAVVAITLFMISKISYLLEGKTTYENYAAFVSDDEEYDVFLLGSSHVRYGFFPMELWKDYGITSYNISGDSNTMAVNYWVFKQALKYHKPQTVVLDVYDCSPNDIVYSWEFTHDATGIYPVTLDKIKMVPDLARDPNWTNHYKELTGTRWELIFKLAEFHSRWEKLLSTDYWSYDAYVEKSKYRKGIKINSLIAADVKDKEYDVPGGEYDELAKEYLLRIIDLCAKNEIKLVLVNTGFNANSEMLLFANSIPEIASEYGLDYIDYTAMDLIDYSCDFHTIADNTHVNVAGARKFTRQLGAFLLDNNYATDHRTEAGYEMWDEDYQKYNDYMIRFMQDTEYFEEYVEMLYGTEYDVVIDIYDDSILEERNTKASLHNLGVDIDAIGKGSEISLKNTGVTAETEFGIEYVRDISYGECDMQNVDGRVSIKVLDSKDGSIIDERVY